MSDADPGADRGARAHPTSLYGVDAPAEAQRESLREGRVPVAVHGLGRIGLPVAAVVAETTGNVTGVDVEPAVVESVRAGESPVAEPGLDDLVGELVAEGALTATTDVGAVEAAVHVVVVPTLLEGTEPDLSALEAAAGAVGEALRPGDLVVVESTVPPGTCEDLVVPELSSASGLDPGRFGVAHCPERTSSGRALRDVRGAYPRVVGGVDAESTRATALFYGEVVDERILRAPDARTAECVKLFEGVYRDVNIALANDLARVADDLAVDVPRVIELANTQPYCELHDPGPGVGGHCIPYYPHFLLSAVGSGCRLVRTARSVNDAMPAHTVGRLVSALSERGTAVGDASVVLAGLTYRPDVTGTVESPALTVADLLSVLDADVYGVDPLLSAEDVESSPLEFLDMAALPERSAEFDAAVVATPHRDLVEFDWDRLAPMLVLDARDALDLAGTHHDALTLADGSRPRHRSEHGRR